MLRTGILESSREYASPPPPWPAPGNLVDRWDFANDSLAGYNGNTWSNIQGSYSFGTDASLGTHRYLQFDSTNTRFQIPGSMYAMEPVGQ